MARNRTPRDAESTRQAVALSTLMILTFVTGVVDAVGYLALDRVFVGNMTGNIVILGMAVAGGDDLPILGPAIALAAFTVAAFAAGLFLRTRRKEWGGAVTGLLIAGAVVIAALGVAFLIPDAADSEALILTASTLTAAAMGMQAAVARSLAVADMTTVVVTSTLTSLASESLVDGGIRGFWNRRLGAIVLIFLGALAGAALLVFGPGVPLLLAALLTVVVVVIGHRRLFTPARREPVVA
ncbi:YoaK family protein [Microbacterium imperiale]|uniref:DUF1275 family protein n=1 Tax=Microbacterium imperiale TaxID=33884 RepID=A0A9W6HHN4_9MICO|nr:YoaK family protein [Microbacterium imperiale]MBP2420982.1 uncharacterized membrane protein YoaK (UPF0700 family) [Microbacterium imperiale]BFE41324.1 YoaK family protein [Microbacterium imperiale]GLJ80275.1 DUF1275 family protein [Microbacterium imperiale]